MLDKQIQNNFERIILSCRCSMTLIGQGKEHALDISNSKVVRDNCKKVSATKRKVHNETEWKRAQDAVCWIHLAKAQEKGVTDW